MRLWWINHYHQKLRFENSKDSTGFQTYRQTFLGPGWISSYFIFNFFKRRTQKNKKNQFDWIVPHPCRTWAILPTLSLNGPFSYLSWSLFPKDCTIISERSRSITEGSVEECRSGALWEDRGRSRVRLFQEPDMQSVPQVSEDVPVRSLHPHVAPPRRRELHSADDA